MSAASKEKIQFISLASVVSALAVVFLHVNSCFWTFDQTARWWKSANVIESVCYFAVPVFFMISGATLLDYNKRYGMKEYFKKRFFKAVLPYLVWSAFGIFFRIFYIRNITPGEITPEWILSGIFSGEIVSGYWFFIPLFCVYAAIPLFAAVAEEKRKKTYTYISIACFCINMLVPFLISFFKWDITFPASIRVGTGYLFFIMVGYLLSKYHIKPLCRFFIYAAAVAGLVIHLTGTYYYSVSAGEIVKLFKGYENVPSVLYATGVFLFFRYAGSFFMKAKVISVIINFFSGYTFALYLIHWYIIQIMVRSFEVNTHSITYRIIAPFIIFGITIGVSTLIRLIPGVRKILP